MKRLLLLLLLAFPLHATEYAPWFSPLWEFQWRVSFFFDYETTVQSPKSNFSHRSNDYTLHGSLGITPWPYWNVEAEIFLTRTHDIPFSYEAAFTTIRYQWLDDIRGDPFALATGLTLSFPGQRYLKDLSFAYHGEMNAELHATIGKEWARGTEWWMRGWLLSGLGIANRGSGWYHGLAVWEFQPTCLQWGVYTEALYGFGSKDITLDTFSGYASIDHRILDLGTFFNLPVGCLGTLTCLGWYNVYAHNFVLHSWGLSGSLLIPFSL